MDEELLVTPDMVLIQNKEMLTSPLAAETVLLDMEKIAYYGLDETATFIWEQLAEPRRVGDVIDALLEQFEIDRDTCEEETLALLTHMHREGAVVLPAT